MKTALVVTVFGLLLMGCGKSPFDTQSAMVTANDTLQYDTMIGCREWVSQRDAGEIQQYDTLAASDKTFALMHRETMRMVSSTFGNGKQDPCAPGTNVWDAYMAYIKEVNETGRTAITSGTKMITQGLNIAGAVLIAGEVAGALDNNGTKTSVQGDYTTAGGDQSLGNTFTTLEVTP